MGLLKPHRLAMKAARHHHKADKRKRKTATQRARTISANRHRS